MSFLLKSWWCAVLNPETYTLTLTLLWLNMVINIHISFSPPSFPCSSCILPGHLRRKHLSFYIPSPRTRLVLSRPLTSTNWLLADSLTTIFCKQWSRTFRWPEYIQSGDIYCSSKRQIVLYESVYKISKVHAKMTWIFQKLLVTMSKYF